MTMDEARNGDAQAVSLSAPRTPAGQSGVRFDCQSTDLEPGRQGEQGPFDREASLALDVQHAALDEIAEGFGHLRAAYQISPANGYLPKALLATVEAFGEAVGAVRELEHEARL